MFGRMNSFEQGPKRPAVPQASPEEILAALKARDAAAREKAEALKKLEAERAKAEEIRKGWAEGQKPYEITAEDVKAAEELVGKKFEQRNQ